jgi:hypothetical protein
MKHIREYSTDDIKQIIKIWNKTVLPVLHSRRIHFSMNRIPGFFLMNCHIQNTSYAVKHGLSDRKPEKN